MSTYVYVDVNLDLQVVTYDTVLAPYLLKAQTKAQMTNDLN